MNESLAPRRSIRGKLDRLVLLSVGAALGIAAVLSIWQETGRYIVFKRETLITTAQVFGAASSKAVASRNAGTVLEAIRAIARVPGLIHAQVEDVDGASLAEIGAAVRLAGDFDLDESRAGSWIDLLTSRTVQVSVPVIEGGQPVGRIVIVSDTSDLFERFQTVLLTASGWTQTNVGKSRNMPSSATRSCATVSRT